MENRKEDYQNCSVQTVLDVVCVYVVDHCCAINVMRTIIG